MNSSTSPIKANHKLLYSTRNNTFLRNQKIFEKQRSDESPELNLNSENSERLFQNNQAIAQRLLEAKARSTYRAPSLHLPDTSILDSIKSPIFGTLSHRKDNVKGESFRTLARTLSVPHTSHITTPSSSSPQKSQEKPRASNPSLILEPSSEHTTKKSEEGQVDLLSIAKEIKAMQRFEEDRKKNRSIYRHKTDISYLTDNKRPTIILRELQVGESHTAVQSQPNSPRASGEESTKNAVEELIPLRHRTFTNLSPKALNDRTPSSLIVDSLDTFRRQGHKHQTDITPGSLNFTIMASQKLNELKSMPFIQNNVLLTPLTTQSTFFSKGFYPDNRIHEGAALNLENLPSVGYFSGFKETASGGSSPYKLGNGLPKITDLGKTSSELQKKRLDEPTTLSILAQDLRRELPNTLSGAPPSRNDAIMLSRWIESKLKAVIESTNMEEKQKCLKCDEIYNIALNEIIRQVGFDCAERAEVLNKIWMSYLRMFQQFKVSLIADQVKARDEHEEAYNRVHKMYKNMLNEASDRRAKLEKQLSDLSLEHATIKSEYERLLNADSENLQKNRELRGLIKKLAKQLEKVQAENQSLQSRLSTKGFQQLKLGERESPRRAKRSNTSSPFHSNLNIKGFSLVLKEENESNSSVSEVSSDHLAFEEGGEEGQKENLHKIEHLNTLALVHSVPDIIKYFDHREAQTGEDLYEFGHRSAECQTDLRLLDSNYDALFATQNQVDDLVTEHRLKKEVDALASTQNFDMEGKPPLDSIPNTLQKLPVSISEMSAQQHLELIEEIQKLKPIIQLQGIGLHNSVKEGDTNEGERKKDGARRKKTMPRLAVASHSSLAKSVKIKLSKVKTPENQSNRTDDNSPVMRKSSDSLSPTHNPYRSIDSESILKSPVSPSKRMNKAPEFSFNEEPSNIEKKVGSLPSVLQFEDALKLPEPMKDKEEGSQSQNSKNNLELRPDYASKLQTQRSKSMKTDSRNNSPRRTPLDKTKRDENNMSEGNTDRFSFERALQQEKSENSSDYNELNLKQRVSMDMPSGDDENQINLDELDPSNIYNSDEEDPEQKQQADTSDQGSFSTILEDDDEDVPLQNNLEKKPSRNEIPQTTQDKPLFSRVSEKQFTLQIRKRRSKTRRISTRQRSKTMYSKLANDSKSSVLFSLATLKPQIESLLSSLDLKRTSSDISQDSLSISGLDGSKLMQIVRMYKVENEKSKLFQKSLEELKTVADKEREHNDTLALKNDRLKAQLDEVLAEMESLKIKLENSVKKCEHGGCPICLEEEKKAANEKQARNPEEENDGEEAENAKTRNKLKRLQSSKKIVPQNMIFGRRNAVEKRDNPALAIISKLKTKKMSQFKNFMPLKMVLKQINSIYEERVRLSRESTVVKEEELSCFIFNMFLNLFGFKKIAEQKFIVFILSVKKYLHIVRINIFARFLGLIEGPGNFSVDELNKYIECLDFLNTNSLGVNIPFTETDSKQYTPYVRFQEYLRTFAEGKLGMEEYIEFKKDFEALKETDPKNVNRLGVIDIDMAMMKILAKFKVTNNRTKQYLIDAFSFVDLNGDKLCDLTEFKLMMSYVEPEKFDESTIEQIFEEYAEAMSKDGMIAMSYDQFAVMCAEQNFFSEYQQDRYLMVVKKEQIAEKFNEVFKNWPLIRDEMETCLRSAKNLSVKEGEKWEEYIDLLWKRVLNPTLSEKERKPLLVIISVFLEELKKFL